MRISFGASLLSLWDLSAAYRIIFGWDVTNSITEALRKAGCWQERGLSKMWGTAEQSNDRAASHACDRVHSQVRHELANLAWSRHVSDRESAS